MMSVKKTVIRLPDGSKAILEMNSADQIIRDKGLDLDGDVQMHHTNNVLKHIVRYLPYNDGMLIKGTQSSTNIRKPVIVTPGPSARFLFHGKLMVSDVTGSAWARKGETKHVVSRNLNYTKTNNPQAGPYWDKALVAAEGAKLVSELQKYINQKG